jgi:hypothetical protein
MMRKKLIVSLALLMMTSSAFAGLFTITNRACGSSQLGGGTCNANGTAFFDGVEDSVNSSLPDADASTYLTGMANANVGASRGVYNDYVNDIDFMLVGVGAGVGVDLGDNGSLGDTDTSDVRGFGLNGGLTIGIDMGILPVDKLGPIDFEKMDLFIGFTSFETGESGDEMFAEMTAFSIMARYELMEGMTILPAGMLKWGGLHLSAGFQKTSFEATFTESFSQSVADPTGSGSNASAAIAGDAVIGIEVSTYSVPIEISTYAQFLYIFSIYGGLGFDLNGGSADSVTSSSPTISISGGDGTDTGTGNLDLGDSGDAQATDFRGFIGLQIGVPILKFNVQVNQTISGDSVATVGANLKIVW